MTGRAPSPPVPCGALHGNPPPVASFHWLLAALTIHVFGTLLHCGVPRLAGSASRCEGYRTIARGGELVFAVDVSVYRCSIWFKMHVEFVFRPALPGRADVGGLGGSQVCALRAVCCDAARMTPVTGMTFLRAHPCGCVTACCGHQRPCCSRANAAVTVCCRLGRPYCSLAPWDGRGEHASPWYLSSDFEELKHAAESAASGSC
jgi:hypothetical protein